MGWWSIGGDEISGEGPAEVSAAAFRKLVEGRGRAGKPALRWDEMVLLLCGAVGRSGRELEPRPESRIVGLEARFKDGAAPVRVMLDEAKVAPAEEVAVLKEWVKAVTAEHRSVGEQTGRKRPSAREVLHAAAFVLEQSRNELLADDETRKLEEIVPLYEHASGQLSAEEVVAAIAAALRRNERRLGLMVENGAAMAPETVIATSADGRELSAPCETAQAPRELVDDMCERFGAVIREHRLEMPDAYVKKLSAHDREKYQRNADARGLPKLVDFLEQTRLRLALFPERWTPLTSLRLATSERSTFGLPTRSTPAKFVDSRLRVRHVKFGEGFVERTFEDGEKKYEVVFDGGKRVTLMARFLEPVTPAGVSQEAAESSAACDTSTAMTSTSTS